MMSPADESRVIEMAWEDRTPFEAIFGLYGMSETDVIRFMRWSLKPGSFKLWRERVSGRSTKHLKLRDPKVGRSHCSTQYKHRPR
ncbi:TIGR03643 family protein [Marinobacter sp.]|uniref:TIGR03643 family protein n=1 Tax=Marinobacter sp. TaxID=50741 RepID=UPI003A914903